MLNKKFKRKRKNNNKNTKEKANKTHNKKNLPPPKNPHTNLQNPDTEETSFFKRMTCFPVSEERYLYIPH